MNNPFCATASRIWQKTIKDELDSTACPKMREKRAQRLADLYYGVPPDWAAKSLSAGTGSPAHGAQPRPPEGGPSDTCSVRRLAGAPQLARTASEPSLLSPSRHSSKAAVGLPHLGQPCDANNSRTRPRRGPGDWADGSASSWSVGSLGRSVNSETHGMMLRELEEVGGGTGPKPSRPAPTGRAGSTGRRSSAPHLASLRRT
mmetsp:Transcript_37173/g.104896  ORF Transcript_37173/g.104896 Transcript_37173/m.104896 type:complete len:202 (-) Transcript_37173:132-737(-)